MKDKAILHSTKVSSDSKVSFEQSLSMRDIYTRYCLTGEAPGVRSSGLHSVDPDTPLPSYGDVVDGMNAISSMITSEENSETNVVTSAVEVKSDTGDVTSKVEDLPE